MATLNSSMPSVAEPLRAAGFLFSEIAGDAVSLVELLHEATQANAPGAMLAAAAALAKRIGSTADRAGEALACDSVQRPEAWLLSPRGGAAMSLLEGMGRQQPGHAS